MNKIYKVLWNAVRSNRVVTSEAATAHGKGKQAAVLVAGALAAMAGGAQASNIEAADGWGHTTIQTNDAGTVFNVTTNCVNNINPTPIYSPFLLLKIAGLHIDV